MKVEKVVGIHALASVRSDILSTGKQEQFCLDPMPKGSELVRLILEIVHVYCMIIKVTFVKRTCIQ